MTKKMNKIEAFLDSLDGTINKENKVKQASTILLALIGPNSEFDKSEQVKGIIAWWNKWPSQVRKEAYIHPMPGQPGARIGSVQKIAELLANTSSEKEYSAMQEIHAEVITWYAELRLDATSPIFFDDADLDETR